jgi:predicted dienelactone hydrolase
MPPLSSPRRRLMAASALAALLPRAGRAGPSTLGAWANAGTHPTRTLLDVWHDYARRRTVPIKAYVPEGAGPWPLVLYSHGLGGSREGGRAWGEHWASHGLASLHPQHAGSDEALWRGAAGDRAAVIAGLRRGMGVEQLLQRVRDMGFVLDQVERRAAAGEPDWRTIDPGQVGIAGHSFGAVTTQALMGQRYPAAPGIRLAEPRAKAAMLFSPSARGGVLDMAFASVAMPVMCWTGTRDELPDLAPEVSAASRAEVFAHLPPGDKLQVVFEGGDHMLFAGDRLARRDDAARDERQWRLIRAGSAAFWRAHLAGDADARAWLGAEAFGAAVGAEGRYSAK